jgi:hypothetical protein
MLSLAAVNMCKCNAITHALLNTTTNSHILLIQEPWFDTIGMARKDSERQGVDVRGGVAAPGWEIHYPGTDNIQRPKVMAYSRKIDQRKDQIRFTATSRNDICSHPCIQVLDMWVESELWRVINFYHDVCDNTCLPTLLGLDIDAVIPTLIMGDFNMHLPTWSTPDTPRSAWANRLEEWAVSNLLNLANEPGVITRRGAEHERDSVIDLVWYNKAAILKATFTNLQVDWEGGLGSDHAMIHINGSVSTQTPATDALEPAGFLLDPERKPVWLQEFKAITTNPPLGNTPNVEEVEFAAASFTADIQSTNDSTFRKCRPSHHRASPWWNAACALAAQELRSAQDAEAKATAQKRLKGTVRAAKRNWADEYIQEAELWEVTNWRHGRRLTKVPPLKNPGGIAHTHEELMEILTLRFFGQSPPEVPENFSDDPDPKPPRTRQTVNRDMVDALLQKVSNRLAPGQTGHSWTLIKWAWEAHPERLVALLEACLRAGHHPKAWKEAVVCVIPKPN